MIVGSPGGSPVCLPAREWELSKTLHPHPTSCLSDQAVACSDPALGLGQVQHRPAFSRVRWGGINERQEVGQREACGRRQREVHPQQLHTGSELGVAGRALQKPQERAPATHQLVGCLSAFCQCLKAGDRNPGIFSFAGLIFY